MRLESLKKGFWGYKRDAVFQYITEQEELFSQKMAEKDAQLDRAGQQAQARIQELEQENRALKEELTLPGEGGRAAGDDPGHPDRAGAARRGAGAAGGGVV